MKSIYSKLVIGFLLTSLLSFSICCFFTIKSYNHDSDQLALEELEHSSDHIADLIKLIDDKDQDKILADYSETSEMSNFKYLSIPFLYKSLNLLKTVSASSQSLH